MGAALCPVPSCVGPVGGGGGESGEKWGEMVDSGE